MIMGFCIECGEVTAQPLCFECFSRFDLLEADSELENYTAYLLDDSSARGRRRPDEESEEE